MYLKRLEMLGFKSFAQKTRLEFEPGMTAIVGPNGCGKSNVSDALRWVLGEQRARALRGTRMEDVIFNGTDTQKPLGMAEVSLTLADCSAALGVEFDEVCITRRVFRSGESGYFLNRKACRLKDIQRLFMDTGVGTDSYSILEQGKIDQILSSRPEDRRAVFEEASGITKYKADKKEALRKLEHTEANLLRLADVIREVKRQIISLQRQAGKARRYKELAAELRSLDLYATRRQMADLAKQMNGFSGALQVLDRALRNLHEEMEQAEQLAKVSQESLTQLEETLSETMETAAKTRGELEQATNRVKMNADREIEWIGLAEQNKREATEARERLEELQEEVAKVRKELVRVETEKKVAEQQLNDARKAQKVAEEKTAEARNVWNALRGEVLALDARIAKLQNELSEIEARDRAALLKRERLTAEKAELERTLLSFQERKAQMDQEVERLTQQVAQWKEQIAQQEAACSQQKQEIRTEEVAVQNLEKELSSKRGQLEMLRDDASRQAGFPPGAQALLARKKEDAACWMEPLVEQLTIPEKYQRAVESVLRPLLDVLLAKQISDARSALEWLHKTDAGSVRILALDGFSDAATAPPPACSVGKSLLECISFPASVSALMTSVFQHVRVVESEEELPEKVPDGVVVVSLKGTLLEGSKRLERWMPEKKERTPLLRHQLRERLRKEIEKGEKAASVLQKKLKTLLTERSILEENLAASRKELELARRTLALQEGERQVIARETTRAKERVETVAFELESLLKHESLDVETRKRRAVELEEKRTRLAAARAEVEVTAKTVSQLEAERNDLLAVVAEHRLIFSEKTQAFSHLQIRCAPLDRRILELKTLIKERTQGANAYTQRVKELKASTQKETARIPLLEAQLRTMAKTLKETQQQREKLFAKRASSEKQLRSIRETVEAKLREKAKIEVDLAECTMRRENVLERAMSAYHITLEEIRTLPDPDWKEEPPPSSEELQTRIETLRSKLGAMGSVNLVAIEEHAELEERFAFLNQQQEDLLAAKKQLLHMIKTINATTTELFSETFHKVNHHFQQMFTTLFGGGAAKLVLAEGEDVLEAGIEIIARPPGKKLQSISLLSGGERTMTAVALLFSLFLVKPSPFCVLDELDAALDDANINRFVEALKGFLRQSQFIIITHSRQTIAAADVIYGVTMQKRGVSKIVSMKFSDVQPEKKD